MKWARLRSRGLWHFGMFDDNTNTWRSFCGWSTVFCPQFQQDAEPTDTGHVCAKCRARMNLRAVETRRAAAS